MIVEIIAFTVIASVTAGTTYVIGSKKQINKHKKNQNYKPKNSQPKIKENNDETAE